MNILKNINKSDISILFAGNSGDGIQFIGRQFTDTSVIIGNNVSTFSDFPSEIRSPKDTVSGISGFQIKFGNIEINSPGDMCDILVLMNAASLNKYLKKLKHKGVIIADKSGFITKKLILAGYKDGKNPLKNILNYKVYEIDFSLHIDNIITNNSIKYSFKNKIKNIFILGFIYSIYKYPISYTEEFIKKKFQQNTDNLLNANINALKSGYNFGQKNKLDISHFNFKKNICNNININGNEAIVLGLISGCKKAGVNLFYSSYPITPASDIFHKLIMQKNNGVKTFQAEDEIAAIMSAIGASYTGDLGVTATSGPGMSLKQEAIGLAVILEIPLVIINVQRAGPSTGLPTKTEQSDLMQAIYGRHGECPVPVLSSHSPSDCFYMAYNAVKIAIEHMTPVILLSDAYLANGSESYKFPVLSNMSNITIPRIGIIKKYYPYLRDNREVRSWITPGMKGYEHRVGSLEKENLTGNVSSDPMNHELMVKLRQKKIDNISNYIFQQYIDSDNIPLEKAEILLLGWGSTYGVMREASKKLIIESYQICHIHIDYLYPFPSELDKSISSFKKKIIIPELNNGQLVNIIRNKYLINIYPINKIQGTPFTVYEIISSVKEISLIND